MYFYIIDQLLHRQVFYLIITALYLLLFPLFLFLTIFWGSYLSRQLYLLGRYYKSIVSLVNSYAGGRAYGNEELQRNINKTEYYKTMWYKTCVLMVICVCENASGSYLIFSLIIGPSPLPAVNTTINCSQFHYGRMNYMLALDAPCFIIPVGILNSLVIYLTTKYAFYNKNSWKLYYQAAAVTLKVAFVSILALIPSIYTFIISQVALSVFLFLETFGYIVFSKRLVVLFRSRNLDLKYEKGNFRNFKQAEQSVKEFKFFSRISHISGCMIQVTVLCSGLDRIIRKTFGNPCHSWSFVTLATTQRITDGLYYPITLSVLVCGVVFLFPYTLITVKYLKKMYKTRNGKVYILDKNLLTRPLLHGQF